jgi:hypothetical protein
MSDEEILRNYSLVSLTERYREFLTEICIRDQTPKYLRYAAFDALIATHSIKCDKKSK